MATIHVARDGTNLGSFPTEEVREGLRTGEQVETWKLMYALLLYSGNDDALALAIAAGGDKWQFVREMNDEARRLGLGDTHFVSPSGVVDVDNYSSAWDLAALTREDLAAFWRRAARPAQATLIVAGALTDERALALAETSFAKAHRVPQRAQPSLAQDRRRVGRT